MVRAYLLSWIELCIIRRLFIATGYYWWGMVSGIAMTTTPYPPETPSALWFIDADIELNSTAEGYMRWVKFGFGSLKLLCKLARPTNDD